MLHAGSGDALDENGNPYPDEKNGELFSPPYLFKGPRPTITSAPADRAMADHHGQDAGAAEITKVSLISIGSVTHAFDANQRFMWLTFTRTSTSVNVKVPSLKPWRRPATTCCSS